MTLPLINSLDDETVRVMVAEEMGWTLKEWKNEFGEPKETWHTPSGERTMSGMGHVLPNYPASLDAMAPALATMTRKQWNKFCDIMVEMMDPPNDGPFISDTIASFMLSKPSLLARAFLVAAGKATL